MRVKYIIKTASERLARWTEITPTCHLWRGIITKDGYGRLTFGHRLVMAHRLAWQTAYGPIPDGMFVCHHCDTPACVRLDHLFLGTPTDNVHDMYRKNRQRAGNTIETASRGERQHLAKLTEDIVRDIRMRSANGEHKQILANTYGVCLHTIYHVCRRKTWKHVI